MQRVLKTDGRQVGNMIVAREFRVMSLSLQLGKFSCMLMTSRIQGEISRIIARKGFVTRIEVRQIIRGYLRDKMRKKIMILQRRKRDLIIFILRIEAAKKRTLEAKINYKRELNRKRYIQHINILDLLIASKEVRARANLSLSDISMSRTDAQEEKKYAPIAELYTINHTRANIDFMKSRFIGRIE